MTATSWMQTGASYCGGPEKKSRGPEEVRPSVVTLQPEENVGQAVEAISDAEETTFGTVEAYLACSSAQQATHTCPCAQEANRTSATDQEANRAFPHGGNLCGMTMAVLPLASSAAQATLSAHFQRNAHRTARCSQESKPGDAEATGHETSQGGWIGVL